jgi:hypothetical protein
MQMIENEVLVPFEDSTMLTISSPIWVDGSQKVRPRLPASASIATKFFAKPATTKHRSGSCARQARWRDGLCSLLTPARINARPSK